MERPRVRNDYPGRRVDISPTWAPAGGRLPLPPGAIGCRCLALYAENRYTEWCARRTVTNTKHRNPLQKREFRTSTVPSRITASPNHNESIEQNVGRNRKYQVCEPVLKFSGVGAVAELSGDQGGNDRSSGETDRDGRIDGDAATEM